MKKLLQSLILTSCLLSCGVIFAKPNAPNQKVAPSETARIPYSNLNEGLNLLSTSPKGYNLYAIVSQGYVSSYVVKDSSGNIIPTTQSQNQGKYQIYWGPKDNQDCFVVEWGK